MSGTLPEDTFRDLSLALEYVTSVHGAHGVAASQESQLAIFASTVLLCAWLASCRSLNLGNNSLHGSLSDQLFRGMSVLT